MRLTSRGWGMLLAGVLLAVLAAALQSLTSARLAAVVLAIPLVTLAWVALARALAGSRGIERVLQPPTWQVDMPASVELRPTGGRLPPWTSLRERVPTSLRRRSLGAFSYAVLPSRRGRVELGPAILQRSDPLAISSWRGPLGHATEVIVWPRTERVDTDVLARALEATTPRSHGLPQRTLEDLTVREYRLGDDLHRVHWRTSARRGELMVRHDEPTTTRVIDVLLLVGAPDEDDDDVTEWSVSAAASMAAALLGQGYTIRVVTIADGVLTDSPTRSVADALDVFATAGPAGELATAAIRSVQRSTSAGVVAVLDRPSETALTSLATGSGLHASTALLVSRDDAGATTAVADRLRRSGWNVATSTGSGDLADAWRQLDARVTR